MTVSLLRGMRTVMFLRLCSRAPLTVIHLPLIFQYPGKIQISERRSIARFSGGWEIPAAFFRTDGKRRGIFFAGLAGRRRQEYNPASITGGRMRISIGIAVIAAGFSTVFSGELSPETEAAVKALQKHVDIGSVSKSSIRNAQDQKVEVVKTTTEQDKDSTFVGAMRFTFEFTDKNGDVYYGQILTKQRPHPAGYEGEDEWEFEIPHGELKYPKLDVYAMEFGFETNKTFVPVAQKLSKVESAAEITARNKNPQKKLKPKGKTKPVREAAAGAAAGDGGE
jgi:hypothetical protein